MMSESIYKKIIEYLRSNPGATPREIADTLGVSIGMIRVALLRLRESGYVVKSVKGGYFVKSGVRDLSAFSGPREGGSGVTAREGPESWRTQAVGGSNTVRSTLESELGAVKNELKDLREVVNTLSERIAKLEEEFNLLMKSLKTERKAREAEPAKVLEGSFMRIEEARSRGFSVDSLVRSGDYLIVGNYIVSHDFLEDFRRKFPISLKDAKNLTREERELLDAMVSEGLAYLHAGREYRLA